MRFVIGVLFLIHGVAHLVGFVVPWRIATLEETPYKTTILNGRVNVGDGGIRAIGVVWLLVALAYMVCAVAVSLELEWWFWLTVAATFLSFDLTIVGWPESRIGVAVNVLIVVVLIGTALGWLTVM
ncbi:MAG: hypothetical protein JSW71_10875 [Gemmatimonadota bacterium]|nr:MAG: hypothetical protein JSW71_10875 [Gemmatimonadota bacterium]